MSSGRFRVNSNGPLHDVWLVYVCDTCGLRRKRPIHRRVRETALLSLEPYRRNDPTAAALHALALSRGRPVPYCVEPSAGVPRPERLIRGGEALEIRIVQPHPCGARWDALLARELGDSRSRVRAAWRSGAIALTPAGRPGSVVRDGDRLRLCLDARAAKGLIRSRHGPPPREPAR